VDSSRHSMPLILTLSLSYTSPLGIGWICAGCEGYEAPRSGFGCAPKTAGPGPGPNGALCPFSRYVWRCCGGVGASAASAAAAAAAVAAAAAADAFRRQCNGDCLQSNPEFPYWGHPQGLDDGNQHWHYLPDPCSNYDTQNISAHGLGCDRASGSGEQWLNSTGSSFASRYLPAVHKLYSNRSTCPQEMLLFFHNVPWTHPISMGNGTKLPLIEYIAARSGEARAEAAAQAASWIALKGLVDEGRLRAVEGRFRQQVVDALAFSEVIVGFYRNSSGVAELQ